MNLFKKSNLISQIKQDTLKYSTPFGNINFNCKINEFDVSKIKPSIIHAKEKTIISSWYFQECQVEFLSTNFNPKIPNNMKIENCVAGVWRLICFQEGIKPIFNIKLETNLEGIPETGEGLISLAFENDTFKLSIGTEDEDYLISRAKMNNWMPTRFQTTDCYTIDYEKNGIQISLPNLKKEDKIQIQFITAWSQPEYPESTWFAVEQNLSHLLESITIE